MRSIAASAAASTLLPHQRLLGAMAPRAHEPWDASWDAAVMQGAALHMDRDYDASQKLLRWHLGSEYSYQSNLRNQDVHPTRSAMAYAFNLLELGGPSRVARAVDVLTRLEDIQEKDPDSRWFGLWSWYLEEPLAKMPAVDFNWADFNGAYLACMILRYRSWLQPSVTQLMMRMLDRCCVSIAKKTNTPMGYTNIACMGTFVTYAGSEILGQRDLHVYALDRLKRFAAYIDVTGSFEEYNSPTYTGVVTENMARMLMYVKDEQGRELAGRIYERAWLHIAMHWHAPTRQIAPPMSRAYFNDYGTNLGLQKALNNDLMYFDKETLRTSSNYPEVALSNVRCPEHLKPYFLTLDAPRMHREIFQLGAPAEDSHENATEDIEGTTYLTPEFCIGSANRSDFWNQRRPLMVYWGAAVHPVQCLQVRVVKDNYDFTSALFYSVQNEGAVLGQVRFRSDGGDRHPSLDVVKNGRFELSRMVVQLLFDVWDSRWKLFVGEKEARLGGALLPLNAPLHVDAGTIQIALRFIEPHFGTYEPQLRFVKVGTKVAIELALMSSPRPMTLDWHDVRMAGCGIAMYVTPGKRAEDGTAAVFAPDRFGSEQKGNLSTSCWISPRGRFEVTTLGTIEKGNDMDRTFLASLDGEAVPMQRLSNALLVRPLHD